MATSTFGLIRSSLAATLAAHAPTVLSDQAFRIYDGDAEDLSAWLPNAGEGGFRVFDLRHGFGLALEPPHDLVAYLVSQMVVLEIGYPQASLMYSASASPNGDEIIDSDMFDIDKAIGQPGNGSWPTGVRDNRLTGASISTSGGARLLRITFQLTYNRSIPS